MELGQLRHFLAVIKQGNFARAAQDCGLTQQALSASIARLERDLRISLFNRGRSGAEPTIEAAAFAPFVELAFTELRRGRQALVEAGEGNIGELRFGIGQTFTGHIAADAIAQMNQERPAVTISMVEGSAPALAQDVIDGKLDFFLGAPTVPMASNYDLYVKALFEITDQVVCSANHPLAAKKKVSICDLEKYPWLMPSPPCEEEQAIDRAYMDQGFQPSTKKVYSDTIVTAQALLAHADYMSVGQSQRLAPLFANGVLTTLPVDFELPTRVGYIGFRREGVPRPCVRRLMDIIEDKAAQFRQQQLLSKESI